METDNFIEHLYQEEKKLIETLAAVRKLQEYYKNNNKNSSIALDRNKNNFPDTYSDDLTLVQKVYVALRQIKSGFAENVAKVLMGLDNSFDEKKAMKVATHYLSRLYRDKVIKVRRHGRKYEYYIK